MLKKCEGLQFDSNEISGAFLMKLVIKMEKTSIFWPCSQEELDKLRPASVVDITLHQNHRIWLKICLLEIQAARTQSLSKGRSTHNKGNPKLVEPRQKHLSHKLRAHSVLLKGSMLLTSLRKCGIVPLLHRTWVGWKKWSWQAAYFPEPRLWAGGRSSAGISLHMSGHKQ